MSTHTAAQNPGRFLALESSGEWLSVGLVIDGQVRLYEGQGGPQSSAHIIDAVLRLLAEAECRLPDLTAIAMGAGPGAFTGLRTACAVTQGLAYGADLPVLPISTLLAVAQAAHAQTGAERVWAFLDARMHEVYHAAYLRQGGIWHAAPSMASDRVNADPAAPAWGALAVTAPAQLSAPPQEPAPGAPWVLAGNVWSLPDGAWPGFLNQAPCGPRVEARPHARALLALAPECWRAGAAVPAEQALPLYVRNKVAQTTAEREAQRA